MMIGIGRQRIVLLLLLLLRPDVDVAALSADVDGGRCDRSAAQIGVTATVLRLVTAAQTESVMSLKSHIDYIQLHQRFPLTAHWNSINFNFKLRSHCITTGLASGILTNPNRWRYSFNSFNSFNTRYSTVLHAERWITSELDQRNDAGVGRRQRRAPKMLGVAGEQVPTFPRFDRQWNIIRREQQQ